MSTLLVYAAAREGTGLRSQVAGTLELGVGKIAASVSLTRALVESRPSRVVLVGVCGAYPARHLRPGQAGLAVGERCVVGSDVLADEGLEGPAGFVDLGRMDLGAVGPFVAEVAETAAVAELLGCPIVRGATVSTCAGVEALSATYAARTGAQVETMEGAAVALVCARFDVPLIQLRVVSNLTGDRERGGWDLDGAITALEEAVGALLEVGALGLLSLPPRLR